MGRWVGGWVGGRALSYVCAGWATCFATTHAATEILHKSKIRVCWRVVGLKENINHAIHLVINGGSFPAFDD